MPLIDVPFKPGFFSDTTDRGVGKLPQWKGGNRVRFYRGFPETIGGWIRESAVSTLAGAARFAVDWQTLALDDLIAIGTSSRLYIISENTLHNITPLRETGVLVDPFTTTAASTEVQVTDVAHGLVVGTYVEFSGASAVGGVTVDGEYTVTEVIDNDNYKIVVDTPAAGSASGGGNVNYEYGINAGYVDSTILSGFGIGPYGAEDYGEARAIGDIRPAQLWSLDNWGEDLIACFRDGSIYVWDASGGFLANAVLIANAPTPCKFALVSTEDRHLIAFGADGDPMFIRWCNQEDYDDWTPTLTNTAGDKRLDQGNQIMCAIKLRAEILVMTDAAGFSMQHIGPPYTFGFKSIGSNYGLLGPNAVREYEGQAFWMGTRGFYRYDGAITPLDCPVLNHVFDDINLTERFKIHTALNYRFNEVWWFYPSSGSVEPDRYVAYNPKEDTWVFGELQRSVMVADSDIIQSPYAFTADGAFYYHEVGTNDDSLPLGPSLESGDFEIPAGDDSGNYIAHISKYIPDFDRLQGDVQVTFSGKKYPHSVETQDSGPHNVTAATRFVNPRMRCRQIFLRFESIGVNNSWRMGLVRFDILPHGKR